MCFLHDAHYEKDMGMDNMKKKILPALATGCLCVSMLAGCNFLAPFLAEPDKEIDEIQTYECWSDYLSMVGIDKFCGQEGKLTKIFDVSDGLSAADNVEVSLDSGSQQITLSYNTGVTDGKSESLHIHMQDGTVKFTYHYETGFADPNFTLEDGEEYKDGEYPMFTYDAEYICAPEQLSDIVSSKRLFTDSTSYVISVRPDHNCEPVYTYTKNTDGKYSLAVTGTSSESPDTQGSYDFEEIKNIDLGLTEEEFSQNYEEHFDQFYNSINNVLSGEFYSPFEKLGMKIG